MEQFAGAHAAAGAAADTMLNQHHFAGTLLNTLGRQKLQLMLEQRRPETPLVVYLNLPASADATQARRSAVIQYLRNAGLAESDFQLRSGMNPGTLHPVEPELRGRPGREDRARHAPPGSRTGSEPPA